MVQKFPNHVLEKLGWYVYALQDPRTHRIFYIGKGKGNRVFAHANALLSGKDKAETDKLALIREIQNAGFEVEALIIRHAIKDEKEAYRIESVIINFCDFLDKKSVKSNYNLTNIVKGHDHKELGIMSARNVISIYYAPKCEPIREKAIVLRVPVLWTPEMSREELFEATMGWWKLGKASREQAVIALAVKDGVVRGVYEISGWRSRVKGDRGWTRGEKPESRWGFAGKDISDSSPYLNKSVAHLFKKVTQIQLCI